jgi:hypothetical protein
MQTQNDEVTAEKEMSVHAIRRASMLWTTLSMTARALFAQNHTTSVTIGGIASTVASCIFDA